LEEYLDKSCEGLNVVSTLDELGFVNIKEIKNPHDLKDSDVAITKGKFGVAENGAIWLQNVENRAIYFIAKKLVIILDKSSIIPTMHEAYERIDFSQNGFVFLSVGLQRQLILSNLWL